MAGFARSLGYALHFVAEEKRRLVPVAVGEGATARIPKQRGFGNVVLSPSPEASARLAALADGFRALPRVPRP